ncbi:DUF3422 family protein [Microvirga massiliensis]|uniref:DUF3422 family protein n=1 Tax=Microvirga massiliensis TaxID=1033741 RepID=UPI00062B7747|nr:DUF3422 domain-containing protein [Microvirga massiliensis]
MSSEILEHSLRPRVMAELHARPFSPVTTPKRILHYAFATDAKSAANDRQALSAFCIERGLSGPEADTKQARIVLPEAVLRWESHTEFTTYTWEFASEDPLPQPFEPAADRLSGVMRLVPQPGPLLVAIDLHLVPESSAPAGAQACFGDKVVALSEVENGAAIVATDFKANRNGFVRVLVIDRGLTPGPAGALIQRLLEIETYRTLALMGLPEAQELAPVIRRIEIELPQLLDEMQRSEGFDANHRLLDRLTALAAQLEAGAAKSLYRFGATRAYEELVGLRLQSIGERPIPGWSTWSGFLSRRLNPAMRTCASTEERQANLSRKLARAAQLLRTRVNIDLERQNRDLLQAMNKRAHLQLRLQQTVEGLSVAAISYYLASLAHLVFEGAHAAGFHIDPNVATAVVVPVALVIVAATVRRIRRSHSLSE